MATSRDRAPLPRRRLPLTLFIAAVAALLAFAGSAAAETKVGEATSPVNPSIEPEADIVAAKALYDSSSGAVVFSATTAAPVTSPELALEAGLFTSVKPCSVEALQGESGVPAIVTLAPFDQPVGQWFSIDGEEEGGPGGSEGFSTTALDGTTLSVSLATAKAANRPYNCAVLATAEAGSGIEEIDSVAFPIAVPPPVERVVTVPAPAQPAPTATTPTPPPGVLTLGKLKPQQLKVGKWATVKVTLTNGGGSATPQGALKLKAPQGATVKPGGLKLPALLPGESWTLSFQVKLSASAKKKSTLSLAGAAGSLHVNGSLVLKALG
jgi:hypothetical protein